MDLDTFLTTLYVWIDDWYQAEGAALVRRHAGPALVMSDSEVLTVAIAGQWRGVVPWQSERGVVRYMQAHGRGWFPNMLQRSAFNARVRQLWGVFIGLQQRVACWLESDNLVYECVDCVPLIACSLAQAGSHRRHWLLESTLGRGGNHGGWFFGHQLLVSVTAQGAVTGWLLGAAHVDDRWLMQVLISARAGTPQLLAPFHPKRRKNSLAPPTGRMRALWAVGHASARPYLADEGFNGHRWQRHWQQHYGVTVIAAAADNATHPWTAQHKRWLAGRRQIVETVFARLTQVFSLRRLNAHSDWGQFTRLAAMMAAYNLGLWLNRVLGRPLGALQTLLT